MRVGLYLWKICLLFTLPNEVESDEVETDNTEQPGANLEIDEM